MFLQLSLSFSIKPYQLLLLHILPDQLKCACWKSVFLQRFICLLLVLPPKMSPTENKGRDYLNATLCLISQVPLL